MKYLKGEKAEAEYYLVGNATKIQVSLIWSGNQRQIGLARYGRGPAPRNWTKETILSFSRDLLWQPVTYSWGFQHAAYDTY